MRSSGNARGSVDRRRICAAMQFKCELAIACAPCTSPTRLLIKALRPGARSGGQPEPFMPLGPQPFHHDIVQRAAMAVLFMFRVNKQSPDVAVRVRANRKANNGTLSLRNPAAPRGLDGRNIVRFRDDRRRQPIFTNGQTNAMHRWNVVALCFSHHVFLQPQCSS